MVKRLVLAAAIVAVALGAAPSSAATGQRASILEVHPVVMRFDGLTGDWFFGQLSTVLIDAHTGDGIQGATVQFTEGSQVFCSGVTNMQGVAYCTDPGGTLTALTSDGYTANFAGNADYLPSSGSAKLANVAGTDV